MRTSNPSSIIIVAALLVFSSLASLPFIFRNIRAEGGGNRSLALKGLPDAGNYNFITLGDVNNDTYPDIIASGAGRGGYFEGAPGGLHVYVNRNGTSFVNESNGLPIPIDEDFHATHSETRIVDINGDSNPDIVAAEWLSHQFEGRIRIYLGNGGEGGQMSWTRAEGPELYGSWSGVDCGDIDGDGSLDIVAGGAYGLNIWKGSHVDGTLNWTDASSGIPESIHHVSGIELADVNHDGRLDIVAGMEEGPGIQIFTCSETGDISWTEAHSGTAIADIGIVWDVELRDLDEDGNLDLIASKKNGVRAYLGNGNSGGRSTWWMDVSNGLPSSGTYYQLAVYDMDNDGKLDIGSALQVWSNSGSISEVDSYSWEGAGYGLPDEVPVGMAMDDMDLDGKTDVVCCGWDTNFQGIHAYVNLTLDPDDPGGSGGVPPSEVPGERVWFVKKDIIEDWAVRTDTEFIFVAMIGWSGLMVENTQNNQKVGYESSQPKNTMGEEIAEWIMNSGWKTAFVIYDDGSQNLHSLSYELGSYPFNNPYNWPYGLEIIYFDGENSYQVSTTDPENRVVISMGSAHRYSIDWNLIKNGDRTGVLAEIDKDGDGNFEDAMTRMEVTENIDIVMVEGLYAPGADGKDDGKGISDVGDNEVSNAGITVLIVLVILVVILGGVVAFLAVKKKLGSGEAMNEEADVKTINRAGSNEQLKKM